MTPATPPELSTPITPVAAPPRCVALVGNANVGKTTLFNRLTGMRQRTGNYPGVTVERKTGVAALGEGVEAMVIDLPGTYTLAATSRDERIVLDVLLGRTRGASGGGSCCGEGKDRVPLKRGREVERPDAIVCVVDATNLLRNLFLVSQVADIGLPLVIAVNMIDEARVRGIRIDAALLSARLGAAVVPVSAATGEGIGELRRAIRLAGGGAARFEREAWPAAVGEQLELLGGALRARDGGRLGDAELQRLLFDSGSAVIEHVAGGRAGAACRIEAARHALRAAGLEPGAVEATLRFAHLRRQVEGVVRENVADQPVRGHAIDAVLTHRVWGLAIFTAMVMGVFWTIYAAAKPAMDAIDGVFAWLGGVAGAHLAGMPMVQSLVVDGVIAGVGGVLVFLPQILILFFFIALLEDSGYMARAAFLMDKLFSWCGLNGKSFVPLLSSFACAVPGVMSTRTIDNPRARLTTILIAPLMSCSARLPVYLLLIGAVVEPRYGPTVAALTLLGFHLIGLGVALPLAAVMNRFLLRTRRTPFVMEMPPYRVPIARDVLMRMWDRSQDFLTTAGTVILAASILIWALSYFPHDPRFKQDVTAAAGAAQLEHSYLGQLGHAIEPVFAPAGFDWRISIGVVASFPARELFVSTMGITLNVDNAEAGNDRLLVAMRNATRSDGRPTFTLPVALSVAVFFALCMQCMATLSVIGREAGWRWSAVAFCYMTGLAWLGAVATFQGTRWLIGGL